MISSVETRRLRHNGRHKPENVAPDWFSNLLRTHAPVLEKSRHDAWLRGDIEPERREWERKVREIWTDLSKAFPHYEQQECSELIHCCWLHGVGLKMRKSHREQRTKDEEKELRRQAEQLARESRALADRITGILKNPAHAELFRLLVDAFVLPDGQGRLLEPAAQQEFRYLPTDLNRFANQIEACSASLKPLKTAAQNSRDIIRISLLGDEKYGSTGMIPLATDKSRKWHIALLARFVNLLHPELSLCGDDIRREARPLSERSETSTHL